ncbi:MAG TPA: alkaline phosphatase family protein [Polyangia bacterium]|nr:alkaline phosphatase family protein [Polyangia bacterium]
MTRSIGKMTMLALGLAGAGALSMTGCMSRGVDGSAVVTNDSSGRASFALQLAPNVTVGSASYMITGPNGFSKSGSVDVSHSTTLTLTVGGLPAGSGYHIVLNATATDGTTTCLGSADFTVMARMTSVATVSLDCHQAPTAGSVQVNGTTNVCPTIDGIGANPGEALVGSTIALTGSAHDTDSGPSPLTYAWQATGGTLDNASAQNPSFTCVTPGAASISLTVSDGDPQASCADTMTAQVACTGTVSGVVASSLFVPGSATDPTVQGGYWQGAKVCSDLNGNGKCDAAEPSATTDASGHFSFQTGSSAIIADIGTSAINTANGSTNASRNVYRATGDQLADQGANVVISSASTEVVRQMEANGSSYAAEKANLATRLGVAPGNVLADPNGIVGPDKTAVLREEVVLSGRFSYAITKLDRGDLYPDRLAVPGGDPEITGLAGVTPATATTPETRSPITFKQAEQAAFNVEGIPRYDHIFIVMLENKSTSAILGSVYAPKLNAYIHAGNLANDYFATGNPSEPNYTALGGGDDFGIVDDNQWNCDATGPNAVQDLPTPDNSQPGLASSPFTATCTKGLANHNIVGRPNLFNAITAAGMTWRTYSESMNPGQDFRTDSVADPAVFALDNVYPPGTVGGNAMTVGTPNLQLTLPAGLYKTKHHPGMAYQNVRSAPEFKYSNRTLGGGQWDAVLKSSTKYAVPANYDLDQLGTDLASGAVGNLNFVMPDQCDDMHGISVTGKVNGNGASGTASDCSSIANNSSVGAIITRGDNYVDYLVKKIQASPLWQNQQKKVAIVLMFDEGNATTNLNSCCGWMAGKTAMDAPLVPSGGGFVQDTSIAQYNSGNKGHGKSIFVVLNNQPAAPKGIVDTDAYSHFSFVRTLQDMFGLADPKSDASYMNRSKYTEKFIAQNIMNLPEFAGSADTHYDAVRPMNHAYVIPAGYQEKASADDNQPQQVGPDATQKSIWSIK